MDFGLDFYLIIAYLIPGLVGLKAVSIYNDELNDVLQSFHNSEKHTGAITIVFVSAIVIGMALSIGRAASIDQTFNWDMSWLDKKPQFEKVERCDPAYHELGESTGKQKALELLVKNEKRPYQFYGNMMIAMVLFAITYMTKCVENKRRVRRGKFTLYAAVFLVVVVLLYVGARSSHYRYMESVKDLTGCLGGV